MTPKYPVAELRRRACRRMAVVLQGHLEEETGAHSRLFERLVDEAYIVAGRSVEAVATGDKCREHVVPLAVIRDRCTEYFRRGEQLEQVAAFIELHLKLVLISRDERRRLDLELGLKNVMPEGWIEGDVLARFRAAGIELAPEVRAHEGT